MEEGQVTPPPQAPQPPPQVAYASYPRGQAPSVYGNSARLMRAYRGYHGLSYTLLMAVGCYIALIAGMVMLDGTPAIAIFVLIVALALFFGCFYFSIRSCTDLAYASGWSSGIGIILGIIGPFIGVIGLAIFQYLALNEMKMYGLKQRAFQGLKKKEYLEVLAARQEWERSMGISDD